MEITLKFLHELKNADKRYLDEVSTGILYRPPSLEEIDGVIDIWRKRCVQLGLDEDYRFVPSKLNRLKLSIIFVAQLDLQAMEESSRRLFLLLAEPKPDSMEWRTKLYQSRRAMNALLAVDKNHILERLPATIPGA